MEDTKTLTVKVPLKVWGRLASAAEQQESTIDALLVQAIVGIIGRARVKPTAPPPPAAAEPESPPATEAVATPTPERAAPRPPKRSGGRGHRAVEDDAVAELHNAGMRIRQIAERLGVSRETVRRALHRTGLLGPRRNIDPDAVRKMHGDGMTDYEIAAALGFTRSAIRDARDMLGLPPQQIWGQPKRIPAHVADAVAKMPDQINQVSLSRVLGLNSDTLRKWALANYGPPREQHGHRVRYQRADVIDWIHNGQGDAPAPAPERLPSIRPAANTERMEIAA